MSNAKRGHRHFTYWKWTNADVGIWFNDRPTGRLCFQSKHRESSIVRFFQLLAAHHYPSIRSFSICLSVCMYALILVRRQHAPYTLTRRHALALDREFNLPLHRSLPAVLTAYNDQYRRPAAMHACSRAAWFSFPSACSELRTARCKQHFYVFVLKSLSRSLRFLTFFSFAKVFFLF